MRENRRLIVEGTFAAWAAQDMETVAACVDDDARYVLHMPENAWPTAGIIRGKQRIVGCLADFLRDFDVLEYHPLRIRLDDGVFTCRARIHYGHKPTGLSYEATIGNRGRIEHGRITYFEVFHDTARLRAFYEMVSRMAIDA